MLLTESSAPDWATAERPRWGSHHLCTIARGYTFLFRVVQRRFLVHLGQHRPVRLDPVGDKLPVLPVPLLDANLAVALVVVAGECNRHHQPIGTELGDALRCNIEVLVPPLHLLALERLLAELALRSADRLEVVDRVDDAPVVEYLTDLVASRVPAILVIDGFEDVLNCVVVLAGAVEGARFIADRRLAGRHDMGLGARPPHADEVIHRVADRPRPLDCGRVHDAPAPHEQPMRSLLANLQPGCRLLDARRRDRVFEEGVAVFLRELFARRDRLLAIGYVDIDEADLLAFELIGAALLVPDIFDQGVGLRPIGRAQGEDIRENRAVTGVGAPITHRDDRNLVGGGTLDQRIGDAGRQRVNEARTGRTLVLEPLVALHTLVVIVAGFALLIRDLDPADTAVAGIDHVEIIGITISERDAVRRVGAGAVDEARYELLGLRHRDSSAQTERGDRDRPDREHRSE